MNVVLLTDDFYLNNGMQRFSEDYSFLSFKSIHVMPESNIEESAFPLYKCTPETLFIIAIQDDNVRVNVCKNIIAQYSHVVFMFDYPGREISGPKLNSAFISKKITLYALFEFLHNCLNSNVKGLAHYFRKNDFLTKDLHVKAFNLLTDGFALDDVARCLDIRPKRLYQIRNQIINKHYMGTAGPAFRMHILKKIFKSGEYFDSN